MTNTPNEAPVKATESLKVITPADVLETYNHAHDNMVKDISQGFSGRFDPKAGEATIKAMEKGTVTPEEAMKTLVGLGAEPRTSIKAVEKAATKSAGIREDASREQANSIYETIADYRGTFTKGQINAATIIIMQMHSNKITPQEAIEQLQKI